jgi:N6-adenosine-specific RNA methylase IME4
MPPAPKLFAPLPPRKYRVISADPPWRFATRSAKGEHKSPQRHYGCLSLADLKSLPVQDVAEDNAMLFLWATWPLIQDALDLIDAWGFTYSGLAWEWIKYNPKTGKYAFCGGYGTRKNLEPCLLAKRGRGLPRRDASVRDFILAPRREHSRKPDEQYSNMQRLYDGPYLELFGRQHWAGWDVWGNEASKFGYADLSPAGQWAWRGHLLQPQRRPTLRVTGSLVQELHFSGGYRRLST